MKMLFRAKLAEQVEKLLNDEKYAPEVTHNGDGWKAYSRGWNQALDTVRLKLRSLIYATDCDA